MEILLIPTIIVDSDLTNISGLLEILEYDEVKEFLKAELAINENLKFKFIARFNKTNNKKDISWYLKHIDSVVDKHIGYENFVSYHDISAFDQDMSEIIEIISDLIDNEEHIMAFEMIKHLVSTISALDIDDSFNTNCSIMGELVTMLDTIINDHSDSLYDQIFDWLCRIIEGEKTDYLEDYIIPIFIEYFNEPDRIIKKIDIVDQIISIIEEKESWASEWELKTWLIHKITLLNMIEGNEKQVAQLFQKYIHLSSIRDILIDNYMASNEYDKAKGLLIEGKELYSSKASIVNNYSKKLIEIYRVTGLKKELLKETKRRLMIYSPNSIDAYRAYKNLYNSKEWEIEKKLVLNQLEKSSCDIKIYLAEEKMLTQLMMEIKKTPFLSGLDTYEKLLFDSFSSELLELFVVRVIRKAEHTGSRKHYKDIVLELKRIQKYPDGNKTVENLLWEWRYKYRNRRAMMEELDVISKA